MRGRCALLLLASLLAVSFNPLMLDEEVAIAFSENSIEDWQIELAPTNATCQVLLQSAWSPLQEWDDATTATIIGDTYVFEGLTGGSVHLRAQCDDGTFNDTWAVNPQSGGTLEVLLEQSWNGTAINVTGASTMSWWNANGSISLEGESVPTLLNQSGWLLLSTSNGSMLTAQSNVSAENLSSTDISVMSNATELLRFIHPASGHQVNIDRVDGYFNASLPILDIGEEWTVVVAAQRYTFVDEVGLMTWLNESEPEAVESGLAVLEFVSLPIPGSELELNWSAHYRFDSGMGSTLLGDWGLPLDMQIDIHLNGDQSAFLELLNHSVWYSGIEGLCCAIDSVEVLSNAGINIAGYISANGTWGWNEDGAFSVQRNHNPHALVSLFFDDDPRQSTPLRIDVPSPWEYRSSSQSDWIEGTPTSFIVNRNMSGVSGGLAVSIGENSAPSVYSDSGGIQPYDSVFNIDASASFDHGIGTIDCFWTLVGDDAVIHSYDSTEVELNASGMDGWNPGDSINMSMTCVDHHGIEGVWNGSLLLDGDDPVIHSISANVSCDGAEMAEVNILTCDSIGSLAGQRIWLSSNVSDEVSSNVGVSWYSNKSEDWNDNGALTSIVFHQGTGVNQAGMDVDDRQIARETTHNFLRVVVFDQAGHEVTREWDVEVLDGTGPSIKPTIWIDGVGMMSGLTQPRVGDSLFLDISDSFDDISAVEELIFSIELDDEMLTDRSAASWQSAINTSLPELSLGIHRLMISATDEAGNTAQYDVEIQIHPLNVVDIICCEVSVPKDGVRPGDHEVKILVINEGAMGGWMRLCIGADCIERAMPTATPYGPGEDEVTLIWHAQDDEVLNLLVEWEGTDGEWESYVIKTGVMADEPWSTVETMSFWMLAIVMVGVVIVMLKNSSEDDAEKKTAKK